MAKFANRWWGLIVVLLIASITLLANSARLGSTHENGPHEQELATNGLVDELPLDGRISVLIDPSRDMALKDILAAGERFKPVRGSGVNLGYVRDAAWLRIRIPNALSGQALLSLTPNFVDFIDVHVADAAGEPEVDDFTHYAMGDHRPFPSDEVSGLDNVVPLNLRADREGIVYVRIASVNSSLNISAALYSAARHTYRVTLISFAAALWFGGMGVMILIQLVFYHFERKASYLLLAFSTFAAMLVYVGNLGFSRLLFFPDGGNGNDLFTGGAAWLGLVVAPLAASSILEMRARSPWLHRIFLGGSIVGFVGIIFVAFDANLSFAPYGSLFILALATLAMLFGLREMRRDDAGTVLRAVAYLIVWIGLVATVTQRAGYWLLPNWLAHSYTVSCLIQTLLLTASLAVRLRAAEAMNRSMSKEALVAAQAAEQRANAMVRERTVELADAKRVAEDALKTELESQAQQVQFLEVISHQYRTPLAAIRSNVDSIGLSLPQDDIDNRQRLDRVRRGIIRLVETLELNLSRSRLQGPSFAPQFACTLLCDVVSSAAFRAQDLFPADIITEIDPQAERAYLMADMPMLGIAIINLLENAVKFSNSGDRPRVILGCRAAGDEGEIAVTDGGIGIPVNDIDRIMERAVRGSNASSIDGSGLGLSLVQRIVAAHNGRVAIESTEGSGTTVRLIVPLAQ